MSTPSRRWVKLWHEILTDLKFQSLPLEQQARFFNLLIFVSQHGEKGTLTIEAPARPLLSLMQCHNFDEMITLMKRLPNVQIAENDNAKISVTIKGWEEQQIEVRPLPHIWKKIRERVFKRDDYTCHYCGKRGVRLECDHKTPVSKGGSHSLRNLVTSCFVCNRKKRNKDYWEWINALV